MLNALVFYSKNDIINNLHHVKDFEFSISKNDLIIDFLKNLSN